MSYFNKQVNVILSENIDLVISGVADLLSNLRLNELLTIFECDDDAAFEKLTNPIKILNQNRKFEDAKKLTNFLKHKIDDCFKTSRGFHR